MTLLLPAFPLPANFLLAQIVLLLAAAALAIGVALGAIVVGQCIAWV